MNKIILILTLSLMMCVSTLSYAYKVGDSVQIATRSDCSACQQAKQTLKQYRIPFTEIPPTHVSSYIPQLFVNGEYIGSGVSYVEEYANDNL